MGLLEKIGLTKIKGIGPKTSRTLLAYCGSVEAIFSSTKKQLLHIPGIGHGIIDTILSKSFFKDAENELRFIEKNHIDVLWIEDSRYPKRLKNCEDAPILLYYKGQAELNYQQTISIVGTRNITAYGKRICEEFIRDLCKIDVQIISGLAYGIDIQAHLQSIKNSISTIAVLGHGLDRIYPIEHKEIANKMLENGGLITEFPSETTPERQNFPMRNRIIAGLSDVTIVIEAAKQGGALITAEIANSYNRDVCAFPGRIDQTYSAGCNYLIRTNRAHMIRNAEDLFYIMNWNLKDKSNTGKQLNLLPADLSSDEHKVYNYIREKGQVAIDELNLFCDWPQSKLAIILLELEMKGCLLALPGKIYRSL